MSAVPRLEMDQVLELVNHYSPRARGAAHDEHLGYRPLAEVLGSPAGPAPDEDALRRLAEEAYAVFLAADRGEDAAPVVNALLAPARPTPRLGGDGAIDWEVAAPAEALRAGLGVALLDWLHVRGQDRLGVCDGIECADAYADASPGGRKRFCSTGCLNRHKVAEHRRRTASAAATSERTGPQR